MVLNVEEERWSRRRHDWGAPTHSLGAVRAHLDSEGVPDEEIVAVTCGWDFAAFAHTWAGAVGRGLPHSLPLLTAQGFVDPAVAAGLPSVAARGLGRPERRLVSVPHHDAHAWGSLLLSPFHGEGRPVLVLVIDGMGDRGSLSVHLATDGLALTCLYDNASVFDSLGLMYQWLSSTQGGWTPLASEGRFMGAAAWGERDRSANPYYARLQPMLRLGADGVVTLDRRWINWHRHPGRPYGAPLIEVLGEPLSASELWNPDAVLDPERTEVPELTRSRLDRAAAIQMLFEDAVLHVLNHWLDATGATRVIWTGGAALNCVAALRCLQSRGDVQWWTPPFPGDNGVAAGSALRLAWATGAVEAVDPLAHAFIGGGALTTADIEAALDGSGAQVHVRPTAGIGDRVAGLVHRGAIVGLAQGQAETGPRALGHRSILADPTRADGLRLINTHVKRRESVRPLAPMMLADEARARFELPPGTHHHDLAAWRWMVLCAQARPETRRVLPAVVHVDGTARLQVVDPSIDPVCGDLLEGLRRRSGVAVAVNTSLNVGAPIAHTAEDVLQTLNRARDLHGVVLVGDDGRSFIACRPERPAGRALSQWLQDGDGQP